MVPCDRQERGLCPARCCPAAGLNCVVEGNANGTVQAQSADPGSSVQRGTVVTITCG